MLFQVRLSQTGQTISFVPDIFFSSGYHPMYTANITSKSPVSSSEPTAATVTRSSAEYAAASL